MEKLQELKRIMRKVDSQKESKDAHPEPPVALLYNLLDKFSEEVGMSDVLEGPNTKRAAVVEDGAYELITGIWATFFQSGAEEPSFVLNLPAELKELLESALHALYVITPGNADLADPTAFLMIRQALTRKLPSRFHIVGLKIIKNICTKNEANRETLVSVIQIIPTLVQMIKKRYPSSVYLREWCSAMRALIQNDDRRIKYNRAAERTKILFELGIIKHLARHLASKAFLQGPTQNAIIILLSTMASNEAFLEAMVLHGIPMTLSRILATRYSNTLLGQHAAMLVKYMCMNSRIRHQLAAVNIIPPILKLAHYHQERTDIVEVAMSCLAYMSLRCPPNIACLLYRDAVKDILDFAVKHIESIPIMKNICFLLRNIAVHSKPGRENILERDGENIINQIEQKHPELKYSYTKPLLQDLRLPVSPTARPGTTSLDLISPVIGHPDELNDILANTIDYRVNTWNIHCTTPAPVQPLPSKSTKIVSVRSSVSVFSATSSTVSEINTRSDHGRTTSFRLKST